MHLKMSLDKSTVLRHLFCYTVFRKISSRVEKEKILEEPLNNCSFLHIFASSSYSSAWFKCKKGSILERSAFMAEFPRHDELPKCKGTGFDAKLHISHRTWENILDGLGIKPDDLVLDLNPRFGEFFSPALSYNFCFLFFIFCLCIYCTHPVSLYHLLILLIFIVNFSFDHSTVYLYLAFYYC